MVGLDVGYNVGLFVVLSVNTLLLIIATFNNCEL